MTFKRTYETWGLKDGEGKLRIETLDIRVIRAVTALTSGLYTSV
jgi:hypothetical protein